MAGPGGSRTQRAEPTLAGTLPSHPHISSAGRLDFIEREALGLEPQPTRLRSPPPSWVCRVGPWGSPAPGPISALPAPASLPGREEMRPGPEGSGWAGQRGWGQGAPCPGSLGWGILQGGWGSGSPARASPLHSALPPLFLGHKDTELPLRLLRVFSLPVLQSSNYRQEIHIKRKKRPEHPASDESRSRSPREMTDSQASPWCPAPCSCRFPSPFLSAL